MEKQTRGIRALEAVTAVFLALAVSVYLLYFDATGFEHITAAKRNAYYALCSAYLLAVALTAVLSLLMKQLTLNELRRRLGAIKPASFLLLAYLLLTGVSALLSQHRGATLLGASRNEGLVTISFYTLTCLCLALFCRPRRWMIYLFGASVTLLGAVTVWQFLGGNPLGLYPGKLDFSGTKEMYAGTIGNVGFYAAFLCVAIPVLAGYLIRGRERLRFVLLLPLGLALVVLVRIRVLAGFVGLWVGGVIAAPFVLRFSRKATRWWFVAWAAAALAGLVCVFLIPFQKGPLYELHELLHGRAQSSFGSGRLYIWREVLARVPKRLLLGYGPDTMKYAAIEPFRRYDEASGVTRTALIDAAHNEYLNVLFHQGVFALLAYLALLFTGLRRFFRQARQALVPALCGAAVLCYAIAAFFGISQPITAPFFWISLGLLLSVNSGEAPVNL